MRPFEKTPPFFCLILNTLYFEFLFIFFTWSFLSIVGLIKNGASESPIVFFVRFITSDYLYSFWVSIPFALSFSLIGLKNAVTEVSFNDETREIHMVYHSMITLFIKKKHLRIKYNDFEYYIEKDKHPKKKHFFMPFIPTTVIVFFKDNRHLIQMGNSLGWGSERFKKVESKLMAIKPPKTLT